MFEYQGPAAAANVLQYFMQDHGAKVDADLKGKLREVMTVTSPVPPMLTTGMEILYILAVEKPLATAAGKEATLQTLGVVATAVEQGRYGGDASGRPQRAEALVAWASYQLDPVGAEPAAPDVDPIYSTIAPEPADIPSPVPSVAPADQVGAGD